VRSFANVRKYQKNEKTENGERTMTDQICKIPEEIAGNEGNTEIFRLAAELGKAIKSDPRMVRFEEAQIGATQTEAATKEKKYPKLLDGVKFTSYAIDEDRKALYIWGIAGSPAAGLLEYPLPEGAEASLSVKDYVGYVNMEAKSVNTTADEPVYVKQMVIDSSNGRVYFGFRADAAGDVWSAGGNGHTGLVYYDPETKKCYNYSNTRDEILGVTINPTATKLF
jgi:hypothetical protein